MNKADIRQEIRRRKAACPDRQKAALSHTVISLLQAMPQWQQAKTVLLYHSLPDEVCTHDLVIHACQAGKQVLLPVVVGDNLELREYKDEGRLAEGCFHIMEPKGEAFTDFEAITLAVIPGVAFTKNGQRLGRGKGFYDRLLPLLKKAYKVGICWPFQLVEDIPCEPHDILMDAIITGEERDYRSTK
jgi:5-formyltetrahydrofolate cyclo-ligase